MAATKSKSSPKAKRASSKHSAPAKSAARAASAQRPVARKAASSVQQSSRLLLLGATFFVLSLIFYGMAYWRYHIW